MQIKLFVWYAKIGISLKDFSSHVGEEKLIKSFNLKERAF